MQGAFRNSGAGVRTVWNGTFWDWHGSTQAGGGTAVGAYFLCMRYQTNQ